MSLPNVLTSMRIVMIPVLVVLFYFLDVEWRYIAAAVVFTIASITDWLDGYLARKLGQTTAFGAFLDPVADKLIVAVALVLLVEIHASAVLAIPAIVIVSREIVVSALREWMAKYSSMRSVAVSLLGKVKTGFQMTAIVILLGCGPAGFDNPAVILGYILLYAAAILTIWSMCEYLKIAWPDLSKGMNMPTQDNDE
ncbi:MAG: CDP-diacylglycerol--glycerol-3-phosphate 3-phosphatidyltransferase [Gammaproteobacteria bacterium]|uniref:CDP-diacylglycerol--glycerol-3-phosphate 3-phosphatidyltransferase n=1 Tax=OM182 bacterium TaxID=2510334 RepID=A0A520RWT3_9GAMM|nr:CDP-diacylglycerol--glycerol-3-phosphate 3-phosphatidyltransferase [Gammaproteobacteria bacterium]RZO74647.1 MAG: CDP-diacylglycerol--glycerol-3-phosphate 3-phosphatidyltransferase [OM182 bacterium]